MKRFGLSAIIAFVSCLVLTVALSAQVKPGVYANGSFDSPGFETINLGNLNMVMAIPIINKPGRGGTNFTYTLTFNSAVWYPVTSGSSSTWEPTQNWGWAAQTEVQTGYISYRQIDVTCLSRGTRAPRTLTDQVVYHDPFGGTHGFGGKILDSDGLCPGDTDTLSGAWTSDGEYQWGGPKNSSWLMKDRHGNIIDAPETTSSEPNYAGASFVDTNGNEITVDGSGNFTDTMGRNVLSVSGAAPSPVTMRYTDASGTERTATIEYTSYSVKTSFGCSGITEANLTGVPLVTSITLADGSAYGFGYEASPAGGGAVTGRIAEVTLPTGGTIQYSYGGSNSGISCTDGSPLGITRTTTSDAGSSVRTYARSGFNTSIGTETTNVNDGKNNVTTISFVKPSNGEPAEYYETGRRSYTGGIAGTPLLTYQTCYNGTSQSACGSTALTLPINTIDTYYAPNNVAESGTTVDFNTYGLMTERDTYDYGSATARGVLLQKELWTYPTSGVVNLLSSYVVQDGSGHVKAQTTYGYDNGTLTTTSGLPQHVSVSGQRGNLTSVDKWADSGSASWVGDAYSYDDAGTVRVDYGNVGQTTYTSFDATDTFPTGATLPSTPSGISLTQGASYDSNSGVQTSATDFNGAVTHISEFDPFNRPKQVNHPDGGQTNTSYTPIETDQCQITGTSGTPQTCSYVQYDGYGRLSRGAITSQAGYYQVDYCYDTAGRLAFRSLQYESSGFDTTSKRCSGPGTTMTYDGLGRVVKSTLADGTYTQYTYLGRAVQVTDPNGISKVTQANGLGQPTSVCEVAASQGGAVGTSCGLDIAATGFLTTYAYSAASGANVVAVQQGSQTRTVTSDWLGRVTSLAEPEVAAPTSFSYSYNSTGLQVVRKRPSANQSNAGVMTTTTTQYDALGRILSVTYSDGTPTKQFSYDDQNYLNASGTQRTNVKGRLSTAMTYRNGTQYMLNGFQYSYDPVGRPNKVFQCGEDITCENGALTRAVSSSYDLAGRQTGESDPVAGNLVYAVDAAGEITSITDTSYSNTTNPGPVISNAQYGPYGLYNVHFGNGLTGVHVYDSSGNPLYSWLCSGGVVTTFCSGGTQLYGTYTQWSGTRMTHSIDTVINSGGDYTYDALGNMTGYSGTQGTTVSYSWAYDRYGNRISASSPGANVPISTVSNHITQSGFAYDAAGNETSDGVHTYKYDAENNLISIDGGSTASFTFNALNERVAISDAKGNREYTYDAAGRRIGTWLPGTNTGIQGQIWWGNVPIAYRDLNGSMYFETGDWEGTQRVLSDYTGSVVSLYKSMPWGENYSTSGIDTNMPHYAGLDQAENNSLEHALYRDYDTTAGRWLSPDSYTGSYDWSNPQTFNRYVYASNRPNQRVDPSGLEDFVCSDDFCDGGLDGGGGGGAPDPCEGADACVTAPPLPTPDPDPGPNPGPDPDPDPGFPGAPTPGPGTGTSGGSGRDSAPSNPCANSTLAAAGTTGQQQIATAQGFIAAGKIGASATPYSNPILTFFGGMYGYYEAVHTGGPNDIKNQPGPGYHNQTGVDAGNVSFGITCPYGGGFCQFAAGLAQTLSGNPNFNGTLPTGYDTPSDNAGIRVGQAMRAAGCHE